MELSDYIREVKRKLSESSIALIHDNKSQFSRLEDLAGSGENYLPVRGVGAIGLHCYDV